MITVKRGAKLLVLERMYRYLIANAGYEMRGKHESPTMFEPECKTSPWRQNTGIRIITSWGRGPLLI